MRLFRLLPVAGLLVVGVMGFYSVAQETRERAPTPDNAVTQTDQTTTVDPSTDLPVEKPNYRTDTSTSTTSRPRPQPPRPPISPPVRRPPWNPPRIIRPPISISLPIFRGIGRGGN